MFLAATRISETPVFMKTVMLAFEALAVWAILQLLAARGLPATRVLLYAWHPLPLWQFAGDGHVDAMAIAFLLMAFVAADRRSPILSGIALAAGVLVKYFPAVAGPAIYKRWDWRLPAAFAASLGLLYLPYLGVGTKVFGFLGGYVAEEGFEQGSGIFLWQLAGTILPLPANAFSFYFPLAAAVMAVLGLAVLFRRSEPKADLAAAMLLAVAFMVLFSPHYPWYFIWLIPFACIHPRVSVLYLTCAADYLHVAQLATELERRARHLWRLCPLARGRARGRPVQQEGRSAWRPRPCLNARSIRAATSRASTIGAPPGPSASRCASIWRRPIAATCSAPPARAPMRSSSRRPT